MKKNLEVLIKQQFTKILYIFYHYTLNTFITKQEQLIDYQSTNP